jgi:hypothetical protein
MLMKLGLMQLSGANPNQGTIPFGGGNFKRKIRIESLAQRGRNVLHLPPESKILQRNLNL